MTNKKILVTGGAGYIGSHTVLALLEVGFEVVIFDKANLSETFTNYLLQNFALDIEHDSRCNFVHGDLLDLDLLQKTISAGNFGGVIHFAADPAIVSPLPAHTAQYYTNNVVSSINLVDTCRQYGVNNFVFSSTAAIYGVPPTIPITENSPTQPINVYGYTKSIIEKMLIDYNHSFGLNSIALRYFNACGGDKFQRSGEIHEPEIHLIPCILQSVGTDKVFELYGDDYDTPDGTNIRDYIHVSDLASGHVKALEYLFSNQDTSIREVINLGTGAGYSNRQIFDTAQTVVGQQISLKVTGRRGSGDPDILVADNDKANKILGWQAVYSDLENILQTAWEWEIFRKNNSR